MANFRAPGEVIIMQVDYHVRMRLMSPLVSVISKTFTVSQNSIILMVVISTFFVFLSFSCYSNLLFE